MSERPTAEQKEAAATRRRWINLGEILAVAAVAISGLTLWNSYSERSATQAERAAEKQKETAVARTLLLKAQGAGKQLQLSAHDPDQAIQSQTILFPKILGVAAVDTVIEPRIEAGWLKPAAEKSGKKRDRNGDARVPVAITTRFVSGGETFTDTAIYDVGYKIDEGGLFGSDAVKLRGLSLVERVSSGAAQARLDALWAGRNK